MLNAELKSMNSNLTYVSVLSRCEGWVEGSGDGIIGRAIGPICKLEGVQGGGEDRLDTVMILWFWASFPTMMRPHTWMR